MPHCMYCKSELTGHDNVTHYCFFCKNELTEQDQKLSRCPYCFPQTELTLDQAEDASAPLITGRDTGEVLDKVFSYIQGDMSVQSSSIKYPGFAVKGEIGRGGMGAVLLARDLSARRDIALKTFSPSTLQKDMRKQDVEKGDRPIVINNHLSPKETHQE